MKTRATRTASFALALLTAAATAYAGSEVTATKAALATPSPYTTQVGLSVLRNGGNAVDAAVAVAFALAVVQPQAGNIGGGGYLTYYDASTNAVWTLDFRETAPGATKAQMFADAKALRAGVTGAAVPGTVAGLEAMHRKFGSRPWKELLGPAVALATEGVRVDDDLAVALGSAKSERAIDQFPATAQTFYPEGKALTTADRLVQKDLAVTLSRLAETGPRDFYEGDLAARLVDAVHAAGGAISARDLREYAPVWRAPLRLRLGQDDIYTVGPPSGGGVQLAIALNILGGFDLIAAGYQTPAALHLIAEAERRAAIDAAKYVGDPSATRVPYRDLLAVDRAAGWRKSIKADRVTPTSLLSEAGHPTSMSEHATHFIVADAAGNIASITTTLGDAFGGGFVAPTLGFFLNDTLRDFTDPSLAAMTNAPASGKRPADAMTSVFVLRGGRPYLMFGAAGDSGTSSATLQVLLNALVYGKPVNEAVAAPRYSQRNPQDQLEYERTIAPEGTVNALNAFGHPVIPRESIGDVKALLFEGGRITAIADPRRGGAAGGY